MRIFVLVALFLFVSQIAKSQTVISFEDAQAQGIAYTKLDSTYKSALHADLSKAVFKGNSPDFIRAYNQFILNIGSYLNKNGFYWAGPTRCFNRVYFEPDGKVDYFLFHFNQADLSDEKQKQFKTLLTDFIKNNKIGIHADEKFAQCSPVKYANTK